MTGIELPEPINHVKGSTNLAPTHPGHRVYNKAAKLRPSTSTRSPTSNTTKETSDSATNLRQYCHAPQTKHLTGNAYRSPRIITNTSVSKNRPVDVRRTRVINKTIPLNIGNDVSIKRSMNHTHMESTTSDFSENILIENAFDYNFVIDGHNDLSERDRYKTYRRIPSLSCPSSSDMNSTFDMINEHKKRTVDRVVTADEAPNAAVYCRLSGDELCAGISSIGLGLTKIVSLSGKGFLHLCTSVSKKAENMLNKSNGEPRKSRNWVIPNVPECSCEQCSHSRKLNDGHEFNQNRTWIDSYMLTVGGNRIKNSYQTKAQSHTNSEQNQLVIDYGGDCDAMNRPQLKVHNNARLINHINNNHDIGIETHYPKHIDTYKFNTTASTNVDTSQDVPKLIPKMPHIPLDYGPPQVNRDIATGTGIPKAKRNDENETGECKIINTFDRYKASEPIERARMNRAEPSAGAPGLIAYGTNEPHESMGRITIKGNVETNRTVVRANGEVPLNKVENQMVEEQRSEEPQDVVGIQRSVPRELLDIRGDLNNLVQGVRIDEYKCEEIDIREDDKTVVSNEEVVCSEGTESKSDEDVKRKTKNYIFSIYKWSKSKKDKNNKEGKESQ